MAMAPSWRPFRAPSFVAFYPGFAFGCLRFAPARSFVGCFAALTPFGAAFSWLSPFGRLTPGWYGAPRWGFNADDQWRRFNLKPF